MTVLYLVGLRTPVKELKFFGVDNLSVVCERLERSAGRVVAGVDSKSF